MLSAYTLALWIIIGFVAGVSAKGARSGVIGSILAGIAGAVIGANILIWLGVEDEVLSWLGIRDYEFFASLVLAGAGALLLLYIMRLIRGD